MECFQRRVMSHFATDQYARHSRSRRQVSFPALIRVASAALFSRITINFYDFIFIKNIIEIKDSVSKLKKQICPY